MVINESEGFSDTSFLSFAVTNNTPNMSVVSECDVPIESKRQSGSDRQTVTKASCAGHNSPFGIVATCAVTEAVDPPNWASIESGK